MRQRLLFVDRHSHRCALNRLIDGWHIQAGEDMAVHIIGSGDVVNLGGIVEQIGRLVRQEITVNDRRKDQILDNRS